VKSKKDESQAPGARSLDSPDSAGYYANIVIARFMGIQVSIPTSQVFIGSIQASKGKRFNNYSRNNAD
jgi:hypothetical protein